MERSAMHVACCCPDPAIAKLLLNHNPRLANVPDGQGRVSLWYCLASIHHKKRRDIMKELLKRRAEVNCADSHGRAPLWYASKGGLPSLVSLLLEHRADANMRDHDGLSALDVSRGPVTGAYLDPDFDKAYESDATHVVVEELANVRVEIANGEQTMQGLRSRLQQEATVPLIDVTGCWRGDDECTFIALRQDPSNGEVAGKICTPGQPELSFDGRVVENELIYTTGPRYEPTTFRLRLDHDFCILRGRWDDFRGGSGFLEMQSCS